MKAFRTILLLAAMAPGLVLTSGCATTNDDNVSSIPWDRPQQWEGSGALGGFQGPGGLGH
ncbi:MAG: hypothetical protein ACLPT4_09765 [Verrucomicrobiia bacterium]